MEIIDCFYKLNGTKLIDNNLNKVVINRFVSGKENIDFNNDFWVSMIININENK